MDGEESTGADQAKMSGGVGNTVAGRWMGRELTGRCDPEQQRTAS